MFVFLPPCVGGPTFDYLQFELLLNALDADFCTYQGGNPPWLSKYTPKNGTYCFVSHAFSQANLVVDIEDCGNKPRADVISISYLQTELDFGSFFAQRQCHEYGKVRTFPLVTVSFAHRRYPVARLDGHYLLDFLWGYWCCRIRWLLPFTGRLQS